LPVVVEVDQTTLLVEVLVVVLLVLVVVMLLVGVVREEHNLQEVVLDQFQLMELLDLHFKEDLVLVAAEADTSAVVAEVDTLVVVLMVLAEADQLISVHHFLLTERPLKVVARQTRLMDLLKLLQPKPQ
tara:strand:+ start:224 stop:610 length:387 start_codon:yes stop_codon:yes gene_type:complete